jgi:hypothetical protein
VQFIQNEAPAAEFAQAKPYLDPLEALVSGTKASGDNLESRFLLSVK